jgi:hypothetical protein
MTHLKERCGYRGGRTLLCRLHRRPCDSLALDTCKDYIPQSQLQAPVPTKETSKPEETSSSIAEALALGARHSSHKSARDLEELTGRLMLWAQERNLRTISHADIKMFILHNDMAISQALEQMIYREAKFKYRWLPPWKRE